MRVKHIIVHVCVCVSHTRLDASRISDTAALFLLRILILKRFGISTNGRINCRFTLRPASFAIRQRNNRWLLCAVWRTPGIKKRDLFPRDDVPAMQTNRKRFTALRILRAIIIQHVGRYSRRCSAIQPGHNMRLAQSSTWIAVCDTRSALRYSFGPSSAQEIPRVDDYSFLGMFQPPFLHFLRH